MSFSKYIGVPMSRFALSLLIFLLYAPISFSSDFLDSGSGLEEDLMEGTTFPHDTRSLVNYISRIHQDLTSAPEERLEVFDALCQFQQQDLDGIPEVLYPIFKYTGGNYIRFAGIAYGADMKSLKVKLHQNFSMGEKINPKSFVWVAGDRDYIRFKSRKEKEADQEGQQTSKKRDYDRTPEPRSFRHHKHLRSPSAIRHEFTG